jgi:hypothetical protein
MPDTSSENIVPPNSKRFDHLLRNSVQNDKGEKETVQRLKLAV